MADFPYMKDAKREELHRKLHKVAFPESYTQTITPQQLAELIKAGKI